MGYRSDVVIAIAFDTKDSLIGFCTKLQMTAGAAVSRKLTENFSVQPLPWEAGPPRVVPGGGPVKAVETKALQREAWMLIAYWESVKWYDSYSDVQAAEKIKALAIEAGWPTAYVRIGESFDDTVCDYTEGNGYPVDAEPDLDPVRPPLGVLAETEATEHVTTDMDRIGWALHEVVTLNRSIQHPFNDEAPGVADFVKSTTTPDGEQA